MPVQSDRAYAKRAGASRPQAGWRRLFRNSRAVEEEGAPERVREERTASSASTTQTCARDRRTAPPAAQLRREVGEWYRVRLEASRRAKGLRHGRCLAPRFRPS